MNRIDRKLSERMRFSIGGQGERLYVTSSAQNGNYWLVELPIYLRYSTANHLLNPTSGFIVEYTTTPSLNITDVQDFYLVNQFSESSYHAFNKSEWIVFAQKLTVGSILSESLHAIPLSNRYLGGSEIDLRGYRYRTVSPLKHKKPIGGRSAIYFTAETRFRITKKIGLVPFFDLGRVGTSILPDWQGKWYKSTGLGIRYFSFMGPFRIDIAFPLNRRRGIDPVYKVLVSIGQTF
jgi:translocation and assembly module TamA